MTPEITKELSMDIRQEITNHLEWIDAIASLLGNEDIEDEDLQEITQHDKCALGQWLNSEAPIEFGDLPELAKLIESHEAFHKIAGNLITTLQLDKEAEAIESKEQFIEMSKKVIGYLQVLQEHHRESRDDKK
ncbi:MAG: CZB domain-containing protein [Pseudomonadota bacterium]|nr:CZB domain-containing protein [Pseudomonadota bacterium]